MGRSVERVRVFISSNFAITRLTHPVLVRELKDVRDPFLNRSKRRLHSHLPG
jgi:hypothetical protein